MSYEAVFVAQRGFIEVQSLILAASLRKNLRGDFKISAAVPVNFGHVDPLTKIIFQKLDIEIKEFTNNFSPVFHMANKPLAFNEATGDTLFIDSDCVCVQPFDPYAELPSDDVFCFVEDPFLSYSADEWSSISDLFNVSVPDVFNRCLNTPLIFSKSSSLKNKWLEFTEILHNEVSLGRVSMSRPRKKANMCFGMAVRSLGLNFIASDPLTWNGDPNWWKYDQCSCHPWEKKFPVKNRIFNKILCSPDHIAYFENGNLELLGMPFFLCLQNGLGYCPVHQGFSNHNNPHKIGLNYYDFVRTIIYELLSEMPLIDQHPNWGTYINRYFLNTDTSWFSKPDNYGGDNGLLDTVNRKNRLKLFI